MRIGRRCVGQVDGRFRRQLRQKGILVAELIDSAGVRYYRLSASRNFNLQIEHAEWQLTISRDASHMAR